MSDSTNPPTHPTSGTHGGEPPRPVYPESEHFLLTSVDGDRIEIGVARIEERGRSFGLIRTVLLLRSTDGQYLDCFLTADEAQRLSDACAVAAACLRGGE